MVVKTLHKFECWGPHDRRVASSQRPENRAWFTEPAMQGSGSALKWLVGVALDSARGAAPSFGTSLGWHGLPQNKSGFGLTNR